LGWLRTAWREFADQRPPDQLKAVSEVFLFGLAVVGAIAVGYQLYLTQKSNDMTRESIDFAKAQAGSGDADTQAALALSKRSADAAEDAVALAEKNRLDAEAQNRWEQRAWLGFLEGADPTLKVGERPTLAAWMINSGRTPALGARPIISYAFAANPVACEPKFQPTGEFYKFQSRMVVQPGMKVATGVMVHFEVTQPILDALKAERQVLCLFGRVEYDDIFDARHKTEFNMYLAPSNLSTWLFAPKGNTAY